MHGGDIYRNNIVHDFSVNVNPLGMPEKVREALLKAVDDSEKYPDIRSERLKKKLALKLSVDPEKITLGNGASEIFTAISMSLRAKKALLIAPSFSGYERALAASDTEIEYYYLRESEDFRIDKGFVQRLDSSDIDIVFITNPNNPTGHLTRKALMTEIADICRCMGIKLVLDECFMDLTGHTDSYSMLDMIDAYPNMMIVGSFTKTYAIPGVRLGYMICSNQAVRNRIEQAMSEWNMSCFAQAAGEASLDEDEYLQTGIELIARERAWLSGRLKAIGCRVVDSDADFILFYSDCPLYERLLEKKILIRDCSNFKGLGKGWYRIAVKKHEENALVCERIEEVINGA